MSTLLNLLLLVQVLSALGMIGLILVQHGKGADMGAAFGSGTSGSLFGATGGANFLSRTTSVLAAIFFVTTLALAYFGNLRPQSAGSVLEAVPASAVPAPVSDSIPGSTPAASTAAPPPAAAPASVPAPVSPAPAAGAPASPANQIPGK
jgi:preprotein translocase subunit SecG